MKQIFITTKEYYSNPNYQIYDFPKDKPINEKLEHLNRQLNRCGKYATTICHCKHCEREGNFSEIKRIHHKFFCEVRYCDNPDCLVSRFKSTLKTFEGISEFKGLNSLWHFSIGFKAIEEYDFKANFSKHKKKQEYILNRYFEKLRKNGIVLKCLRVLDFSFKTEGMVFMHYHFGVKPLGKNSIRSTLIKMHSIKKEMFKKSRNKSSFILKDYRLHDKTDVLSYLTIRSSGMYKYEMTKNPNYKHIKGSLKKSIENGKYIYLKNVLTKEEYLNSFYRKGHFTCIGFKISHRHGSNITDNIPFECKTHGFLERKDVRIEVIFDEDIFKCYNPPNSFQNANFEVIKL